ncbi:hypothetical protein THMIRHAM_15460 [Thiomicrorhabdus immobilis]|uniref:carbonic anhydrase n=1 Tax=Thiomicrorhabdus immobilis TaxID=2791037 RepID=A0ABM7MEC2_9GAMM|nr:carbonic anhydrase family protein [Thiomicrorhabdus immobilis]BCN93761.1 hypothetical protein THMIRHAM_15460 [Thiomicrorhabdus immobilis]
MRQLALKTLLIALSLSATQAIAQTPKPSKSDEVLVDLGAELKAKAEAQAPASANSHDTHAAPQPSPEADKTHAVNEKHAVHWGYSGEGGPRHWGDLAPENISCKIGKNQSPIDLRDKGGVGTTGLPQLDIHYRDVPLKMLNNGHTLQVNYPLGSYIKVGGHRYELLQFHFHTPSEHKKEGFNYPMEVHLVHKDGDGNLAVMGVLFQEGEENPQIETLLTHLPKEIGKQEIHRNLSLNPVMFVPGNTEFYKYSGSLTTPPCSEGVYWMVFKHPIEASAEQIEKMNEVMGENARPTQEINSRAVLKSWSEQIQEPPMYEFY